MIASCGGLSLSPVGNYPLQAVWQAYGAFLWLYRVPVSTIMLMGGRCPAWWRLLAPGAGSACRGGRVEAGA